MTSILSAFPFIGEQSFATPGAFNSPLSIISANIAAINADVGAISGVTITPPSGNTIQMPSDLSISGYLSVGKGVSIGTQAPSIAEPVALTIGVNSGVSDYIYFNDTSNLRSDYLIGSHAAGTADGLGLFDVSGNTLIVNFSKQSVRFFAPVIGPAIDTGGQAFSVKGYGAIGDGIADDSNAIQAAIDAVPVGGGAVLFPAGIYSVSTTIRVPADRVVTLFGTGGFASNQFGYNSSGCVIRATSVLSGSTMFSQNTSGAEAIFGVQISGLCFDGNDQTVDLLRLNHVAQSWIVNSIFFNSNGDGIRATGLQNSAIHLCRFFELGNPTAHPNGKVSLALVSDLTTNVNTVLISDCHWESGRGAFLTTQGIDGTVLPNDIISVLGSKMEQSNRVVGLPLITLNAATDVTMAGLVCANGFSQAATHVRIEGGSARIKLDTAHVVASSLVTQNPQFLVDAFSGSDILLRGIYHGGAANNGAQIRVVASSVQSYVIDPSNIYIAPMSGGANVTIANPTAGRAAPLRVYGQIVPQQGSGASSLAPSYAVGSEASLGWYQSGQSAMGLSYGQLQLPSGSAIQPALAFSSESSLGIYRSGASTLAWSYGSFLIPLRGPGDRLSIGNATGVPSFKVHQVFQSAATFSNAAADFAVMWTADPSAENVLGLSWQTVTKKTFLVTNASYGLSLAINGTEQFSVSSLGKTVAATALMGPAGSALVPSLAISSESSLGFYSSGASTMALSYGTFNLATTAVRLSMRTLAASSVTASAAKTNVATNEVVFTVGGASGASLCIMSGGTLYYFNSFGSAPAA